MAECIEREALLKKLLDPDLFNVTPKILQIVNDAPAVSVPQWISVKDRLPEDGEHVLIWYEYFRYGSYNRMYKTYEIAYQYDGFWSGVNPLGQKARVFAWMPLPKPPKGENDG